MSHQNRRRSFSAESRGADSGRFRLGRIVLIGFVVALAATAALISSAASANLNGAEADRIGVEGLLADFALQADPAEQMICAPADAVYGVEVQALEGFTETVTLSVSGEPAGTAASFNPNPGDAPFTSTMTIGSTGSASAGSYSLELSGDSASRTHTITVGLDLFDVTPGTVTLTSPTDGAEEVSMQPLLVWQAVTQAYSYTVEIDDNDDFSSIEYSTTVTGTNEHTVTGILEELTEYYWRVRATNPCGVSSDPDAFSFTTMEEPDFDLQADPPEQTICASEDAVYSIQVLSLNGFDKNVMLSVSGNPVGTTADFDPSHNAAPYTSTLTIGSTEGAIAGLYEMEIAGDWSTKSHTTTVSLDLRDVPDPVVLTSPADEAINIPLKPLMDWEAAAETISYTLEIDDDDAFDSIDYTITITDATEHMVATYLQPDTEYFWRVRADNACGEGSYSAVFSFTTRDVPPVLLVDDDENNPDVQPIYTAALDSLFGTGDYDIWDTNNSDDEPDAELLSFYNAVVWFTGTEYHAPAGPGDEGEAALATWLDGGGCFFISSADYHFAKGLTPFMAEYLGVDSVIDDSGMWEVTGQNTVFAGLGPYDVIAPDPIPDYADEITPTSSAEIAFTGKNPSSPVVGGRPAGVNKQGPTYVTTFLGYPWEYITSVDGREDVLETFFNWCDNEANPSINSSPASFEEDMMADEIVINTLTITNTGSGNLIWDIGEADSGSCASTGAIDWVSLSETSGFTGAGLSSEIEVVFEPDGIAEGDYSGALCINSNDTNMALITVPLDMSVEWYYVYLPYLEK